MARILIVDDGKNIRHTLAAFFEKRGYEVQTAGSGAEALSLQSRGRGFDLILTDYRMAEMNGLELLREAKRRDPNVAVILMTAYANVQNAVSAIKAGAYDYLAKPFSLDQLDHVVERALELQILRAENRRLRDTFERRPFLEFHNPSMKRLLRSAQQLATSDIPILLVGETCTGKKWLAQQIHRWSNRRENPCVSVDCELPEDLLERELFGCVRTMGRGTTGESPGRLEAAQGGTIFFDEISGLSPSAQKKLLRFLRNHSFERTGSEEIISVDTRIIADSSIDLADEVVAKRFREDLFHRLNATMLTVPPLRDLQEDVLALAEHLLFTAAASHRRSNLSFSSEAAAAIVRYRWPGNIRELYNVVERAALLAPKNEVTLDHLPDALLRSGAEDGHEAPLSTAMEDSERGHILRVLASTGTLEEAAKKLGVNAATLWRKRKRYGIE
ncbi:MAG: sigma-54-dependent transcriptional regulator [Candidatus Binataceae bacterium]